MPGISRIMIIGAATAMLGVLLSQVLGISRMMMAMSRRYPAWVAWCGLATCLLMSASLQPPTILAGIGLMLAGFLLRALLTKA